MAPAGPEGPAHLGFPLGTPGKLDAAESRTPFLMWERPWGQVRVVVIFNMDSSFSFVFWL